MAKISRSRLLLFTGDEGCAGVSQSSSSANTEHTIDTISPDEVAFALSVFVSAANGRIAVPVESEEPDDRSIVSDTKRLSVLAESQQYPPPLFHPISRPTGHNLDATFRILWRHYDGHESQTSICTRVLGFYHLTIRNAGTYMERWVRPCTDNPEAVELHPAIIEALASVPLSASGRFQPESFLASVETLALAYAA